VKPYASNEQAYENFTEDTDFITDLNINSANLVDIILDEDAFQIHIDNESMEKMMNVKATLLIMKLNYLKMIGNDVIDLALASKQSNGDELVFTKDFHR
jgi:acyl carrier protein